MRRSLRAAVFTVAIGLGAFCALAGDTPAVRPDPFAPIRFLVGDWAGTAAGEPGEGTAERSYAFVLGDRFLHERSVSLYPAQPGKAQDERHEQESYFSYDRARERIVFRQFHKEGFVNTYVLDPSASGPEKLVFVSEDFENFDDAWRARETVERVSRDEFVETFELAPPGKPFAVYSRSVLKRARRAPGSGENPEHLACDRLRKLDPVYASGHDPAGIACAFAAREEPAHVQALEVLAARDPQR
jgi:hypothetical protein